MAKVPDNNFFFISR